MNTTAKDAYYKGYVAGYRDGLRNAAKGKTIDTDRELAEDLPIQIAKLSTRAKNCLLLAGCVTLGDAAALPAERIARLRSTGPKTAGEIARCLDELGIRYSDWNAYL